MARGISGRVVVEVEPDLKKQLYAVLAAQGLTLKDWFIRSAQGQISQHSQPQLFPGSNSLAASDNAHHQG